MAKSDPHWMEKAFSKNKGKFKKKASEAGESTKSYAEDKSDSPGVLGKEARLAKIGMKFGGHKKKHGKVKKIASLGF